MGSASSRNVRGVDAGGTPQRFLTRHEPEHRAGRVEGSGAVGLDSYDWEYFQPLHEDTEYRFDGGVTEVERCQSASGKVYDRFVFSIELSDGDGALVARITNHWRLRR